jgi:hypothetical protein
MAECVQCCVSCGGGHAWRAVDIAGGFLWGWLRGMFSVPSVNGLAPCLAAAGCTRLEKKKKQIDVYHSQEVISYGHKRAGQGEGKQRDGSGVGTRKHMAWNKKLIVSISKKPEQNSVEYAEWELRRQYLQARRLQHEQ